MRLWRWRASWYRGDSSVNSEVRNWGGCSDVFQYRAHRLSTMDKYILIVQDVFQRFWLRFLFQSIISALGCWRLVSMPWNHTLWPDMFHSPLCLDFNLYQSHGMVIFNDSDSVNPTEEGVSKRYRSSLSIHNIQASVSSGIDKPSTKDDLALNFLPISDIRR